METLRQRRIRESKFANIGVGYVVDSVQGHPIPCCGFVKANEGLNHRNGTLTKFCQSSFEIHENRGRRWAQVQYILGPLNDKKRGPIAEELHVYLSTEPLQTKDKKSSI